eukprot:4277977-Heterocapsa_arctica.AAC.1
MTVVALHAAVAQSPGVSGNSDTSISRIWAISHDVSSENRTSSLYSSTGSTRAPCGVPLPGVRLGLGVALTGRPADLDLDRPRRSRGLPGVS